MKTRSLAPAAALAACALLVPVATPALASPVAPAALSTLGAPRVSALPAAGVAGALLSPTVVQSPCRWIPWLPGCPAH